MKNDSLKVKLRQQELAASLQLRCGAEPRTESLPACTSIPKQELGAFWCGVKIPGRRPVQKFFIFDF